MFRRRACLPQDAAQRAFRDFLFCQRHYLHDLMNIEALQLYEASLKVRERGYMVYKELKERGIFGPQPGLAKHFKMSTFAATEEQLKQVIEAFKDILKKYG